MEVKEQYLTFSGGMEHPNGHSHEDIEHSDKNMEKINDQEEISILNEGKKLRNRSCRVWLGPIEQDGCEQGKQDETKEENEDKTKEKNEDETKEENKDETKEENENDPIISTSLAKDFGNENIQDMKIEEENQIIDHFACPYCPRRFRINSLFLKHVSLHTVEGKLFICPLCHRALKYDWQLSIHLVGHRTPKRDGIFISEHCGKEFDHKYGWQRHVYDHEKEGSEIIHVCREHQLCFRSDRTFRRHRTKCHREEVEKEKKAAKELEPKTFHCEYCNKEVMKRRRLAHMKIHDGASKNFVCNFCYKSFTQKGNLDRHLLLHTDTSSAIIEGRWTCVPCDTGFNNKKILTRHKVRCPYRVKKSVSSKPIGDELTESVTSESIKDELMTSFPSKSIKDELKTSFPSNSNEDELKINGSSKSIKHECSTCKRVHASERALQNHMKTHTMIERKYFCSVCNKGFDHKFPRDRHERSHKKNPGKIYSNIDESSKKIKKSNKKEETSKKNTKVNIKRVSGEKLSRTAGEKGSRSSEEKLSKATGKKNYSCEICQKSFSRRPNWSRHMKIHSEEREMFTCHICDKVMTSKQGLDTHLSSHLDIEEAYLCSECMKIFASRLDLQEHLEEVHVKEKTYQCPLCPMKFTLKNVMQKHFLSHREEDVLSCPHCPKYYEDQEDMNWHIIRSHQDIVHKFSYRDEFYYNLRILEEDPENVDRGEPESTTNRKSKKGKDKQKTIKMRNKKLDVSDEEDSDLMEVDPNENEFPIDNSVDEENNSQKCSVILQHQYTYSGIDDRPLTLWL